MEDDVYRNHCDYEDEKNPKINTGNALYSSSASPNKVFLNVRDILPSEIPHAASLLDTLDLFLAVAFPSTWLSGELVNQMFKIFLGFALEDSIKVIIRKHNH